MVWLEIAFKNCTNITFTARIQSNRLYGQFFKHKCTHSPGDLVYIYLLCILHNRCCLSEFRGCVVETVGCLAIQRLVMNAQKSPTTTPVLHISTSSEHHLHLLDKMNHSLGKIKLSIVMPFFGMHLTLSLIAILWCKLAIMLEEAFVVLFFRCRLQVD